MRAERVHLVERIRKRSEAFIRQAGDQVRVQGDVLRFCQCPHSMEDLFVIRVPADCGQSFRIGRLDADLQLDQAGPQGTQQIQVFLPQQIRADLEMEAGFPVLVEKPAAVTSSDWKEMTATSKKKQVFLMEAVWTRCFPIMQQVLDEIRAGTIGDVRHVEATFAFRVGDDYTGRLTDPGMAGGALLDVGVYGLHFANFIYEKKPVRISSLASMNTDSMHLQVDEQNVIIGQYDNGALFTVTSAIRTEMPDTAWVFGTKGYIRIPVFWKPETAEIICGDCVRTLSSPVPQKISGVLDEGYQFEIRHVQECLRHGLLESPLVSHEKTYDVLTMCDIIRSQWEKI